MARAARAPAIPRAPPAATSACLTASRLNLRPRAQARARMALPLHSAQNTGERRLMTIDPADGLLISTSPGETRIALIEDGRLAEFWIDRVADRSRVGDVHRARVTKVDSALQGAFV